MVLLWVFFGICFLLCFPIGVWCEGYFSKAENRLFWNLNLYGFWQILGGFICFSGKKIWVFRKKSLKEVPIITLLKENKARYDVAKGFHLSAFSAVVEGGNPCNPSETLFFLQGINSVLSPIISAVRTKKNALRISVSEIYLSNEEHFSVTARAVLWLTPLILGFSIVKHLLNERLKDAKRKRKQAI